MLLGLQLQQNKYPNGTTFVPEDNFQIHYISGHSPHYQTAYHSYQHHYFQLIVIT